MSMGKKRLPSNHQDPDAKILDPHEALNRTDDQHAETVGPSSFFGARGPPCPGLIEFGTVKARSVRSTDVSDSPI